MASRVVTQFVSDLSGLDIGEGGGSVPVSFHGSSYTIDLTADETADFERALAPYLEHATRRGGPRSPKGGGSKRSDAKAIREWAQSAGVDVPQRGRIPASVRKQYEATR